MALTTRPLGKRLPPSRGAKPRTRRRTRPCQSTEIDQPALRHQRPQRFERVGDLQTLRFDDIEKFGWSSPIEFCFSDWIHRLQIVDGILDIVGLARRVSPLLE